MMNKNEWKKVKLKELIYKPISGEWGKDYNTDNENTAYVIRTTNFTNNGSVDIFNKEVVKREISLSKIKEKKLKINDIIIEKSGGSPTQPVGRVVFFDIEDDKNFLCNNFTSILRANEKIFPKYLFYNLRYLYQNKAVLKYQNKTTGIINLKLQNYIDDTNIFLPSLEEQKKICKILDYLFNILEMKKQQLSELDKLVKFQFLKMFGDLQNNPKGFPIVTLEELGKWSSGGTPPRAKREYYTGNIDWYSAGELNSLYLNGSLEKITTEAINNSTAKLFKAGSMLIGMYDTAAFKMGILKKLSSSNQACACIEPNEKINIVWLYYALLLLKNYFLHQRRGVRQKNLNLGMIKSFKIPYVDKKEQNKFADFIKQVDKSKVELQKSIDETQLLFDSLMDKYFG